MEEKNLDQNKKNAVIAAVIMFGIVSCFGDIIYEGARSANGQYFNLLKIDAATVGTVYGLGEFLGYGLRLFSGKISDETGKHWRLIFIGYGSLIVIPLMGMTRNINILFLLFFIERIGKALRNPPKDTILSQIAKNYVGTGFVFGLQEALDQLGAFLGPMVFTFTFLNLKKGDLESYQVGYRTMIFAYAILMSAVYYAFKRISKYDIVKEESISREKDKLNKTFWKYCLFTFFATFGLVSYSIIGFYLKEKNIFQDEMITSLYSMAMIVDAITAIIIGKIYDKIKSKTENEKSGLYTMAVIPLLTALIPFFIFLQNQKLIFIGFIIYGIVLGSHETVMRAAISDLTSFKKRGTAYGIFNAVYGLAFLGGSSAMGFIYDKLNVNAISILALLFEIAAMLAFLNLKKDMK